MENYTDILTMKKERHAIIQLNRPEKMNALSHNLRAELFDALKNFEMDPDVRVIIIRGSGRAFSALSALRQVFTAMRETQCSTGTRP